MSRKLVLMGLVVAALGAGCKQSKKSEPAPASPTQAPASPAAAPAASPGASVAPAAPAVAAEASPAAGQDPRKTDLEAAAVNLFFPANDDGKLHPEEWFKETITVANDENVDLEFIDTPRKLGKLLDRKKLAVSAQATCTVDDGCCQWNYAPGIDVFGDAPKVVVGACFDGSGLDMTLRSLTIGDRR